MASLRLNWQRVHPKVLVAGIVIGVLTGLIISGFRGLIQALLDLVQLIYRGGVRHPAWIVIMLGLNLLIGILIARLVRVHGTRGSGIPQIEAAILGRRNYAWWPVLWRKFAAGVLTVGSGAFMGHEGPSVQIGGAVGHGLADLTHRSDRTRRLLIAGGAAAGLSAVFNTPVASCLFVLETIVRRFTAPAWIVTLSAAVTADWVSMCFFGLRPFLALTPVPALPLRLDLYLVVLGLTVGLMGHVYKWLTLNANRWFSAWTRWLPQSLKLCLPLLIVVPVGVFWPRLIGSGVNLIHLVTGRALPFWLVCGYLVFKLLLTSTAFGSGLPGGILLPILTFGALSGAATAGVETRYLGLPVRYRVTLIVIAMAGFFACTIGAPVTAMILLSEMVGSLHHLVALAIVILVACAVDNVLSGQPVYHVLLQRLLRPRTSGRTSN